MKLVFASVVSIIISSNLFGQAATSRYQVVPDSADKVLKGYLNRDILQNDTAFKWFNENLKYGSADEFAVAAFKKNAGKFNMVVFGGTWCHDSQNLLPVFYRLIDKSGFPDSKITLIGLDRDKTAPDNLTKTYNVTNVPTFIVMHNGKEIGRVVEYGEEGAIDKELGDIVTKALL